MSKWSRLIEETGHRPWPLPTRRWVATMRWTDLLFAHWEVDLESVQSGLPEGLVVDCFGEQRAYVGVVPFRMESVGPRGLGALPARMPGPRSFGELNVRTYVRCPDNEGRPGVWFFSLDADSFSAVEAARRTFFLPYLHADISIDGDPEWTQYACRRTDRRMAGGSFEARYRAVGDQLEFDPTDLEHWLTERYCLYTVDHRGALWCGEIHHRPWVLRRGKAEITTNTIASAHGFELNSTPHLLVAEPIDVLGWMRSPISSQGKLGVGNAQGRRTSRA